jgi:hypothetical protein
VLPSDTGSALSSEWFLTSLQVINQLVKRFQPDQTLIKKCIEDLIEREYIQRSPEDQKHYRYVA